MSFMSRMSKSKLGQFGHTFKRNTVTVETIEQRTHDPGEGAVVLWRNLSLFGAFPAILLAMGNVYMNSLGHEHPRPEPIEMPYLKVMRKPFPWGDGKHSLFHNPKTNWIPGVGYEEAGGIGGIFTVVTGHPLDTVKVLMQTKPDDYKGTWDALRKVMSQEGSVSLYKGVMAPLITVVPTFAIGFVGYGYGKDLVSEPDQDKLTGLQVLYAGLISGASTTIITVPAERIKCLLQLQADHAKYNGFMDCGMKLWKQGGIRNLYVGTTATFLRDVPATGLYFFSYEEIMRALTNDSHNHRRDTVKDCQPLGYILASILAQSWKRESIPDNMAAAFSRGLRRCD